MEHLGHDFNAEAKHDIRMAETIAENRAVIESWFRNIRIALNEAPFEVNKSDVNGVREFFLEMAREKGWEV